MNIDFATIMVIAAALTGVVWLVDAWLWAPKRRHAKQQLREQQGDQVDEERIEAAVREPLLVEYARAFFPVILIVLILRSFLVEPFRIPSDSMVPTLLDGDFILVNKFIYGLRLPVVNTKFLDISEPKRGDVVVFRFPKDPSVDYIKRVVGLPGDRIEYRDKVVYVDGTPMKQELLGKYVGVGTALDMTGANLREEHLGSATHRILVKNGRFSGNMAFTVPDGHYFVMGDNRDNSNDSRFWGPVPEENLVGKAFMIWMNWDRVEGTVRLDRLGNMIE